MVLSCANFHRAIQGTELDPSIRREDKDTVDISTPGPSVVILILDTINS